MKTTKKTPKTYRTQIFTKSHAHSSANFPCPLISLSDCSSAVRTYKKVLSDPNEQLAEEVSLLADVRSAHVKFWALVAEEAKTITGFSIH